MWSGTVKELKRFLDIAIGSNCEIETQLYIAKNLRYINYKQLKELSDEVNQIRKMIVGYMNRL